MASKTWVIGGGGGAGRGISFKVGKDLRGPGGLQGGPGRPSRGPQAGFGMKERSLNEVPRFNSLMRQFAENQASAAAEERRAQEQPFGEPPEEEEEEFLSISGTWEVDLRNAVSAHDVAGVKRALAGSQRSGGRAALSRLLATADGDGQTPLHLCATGGPQAVAEAWSRSPHLYSSAPSRASPADGERVVELLVEARAHVNAANMLGETPLLAAVRTPAAPGLVRALLRCQADPDHLDALTGETALMEAACSGSSDLCLVLLQMRADPSCRNPQGQTAYDLALAAGNERIAALPGLQLDAAEVAAAAAEAPEAEGDPAALRAAVKACQGDEVRRLLAAFSEEGMAAALQATDGSGRTLLHLCASAPSSAGAADVAEALLENGACSEACDAFGLTPLEAAVEAGCGSSSPEEFPAATLETISQLLSVGPAVRVIGLDDASFSSPACRAIVSLLESYSVAVDVRPGPESQQQHPPPPQPSLDTEDEVSEQQGRTDPAGADDPLNPSDVEESQAVEEAEEEVISVEGEGELPRPSEPEAPDGGAAEAAEEEAEEAPAEPAPPEPPAPSPPAAETASAPSRGAKGGLRQRCEFHGIPLDKLGTFVAAPALRECERLLQLGLEEVRKEAQACGLQPATIRKEAEAKKELGHTSDVDASERAELVHRLKQVFFWKHMPMSALQAECRSMASEVVEASADKGADGRALEREELVEALTVATWGGLTKNESVRECCREKGIPVERLVSLEQASRLLDQVAELDKKSLAELKNDYKRRGFAPASRPTKEDMVKRLTEVLSCEEMPLSSLRELCKERRLPIKGEMRRTEIVQVMSVSSWEARNIPLDRLPNFTIACGLLDQADRLEMKSLADLQAECRRRDLPFSTLGDRKDLVACLTHVAVWGQMDLEQLHVECTKRGTKPGELHGIRSEPDRVARKVMEDKLVRGLLLELWKNKGIDERIEDDKMAKELFTKIGHLEQSNEVDLRHECQSLGYPAEASADKGQIVDRLTKFLVWRCLPLAELKKDAQLMDASLVGLNKKAAENEQRLELVDRLFAALVRDRWEAKGIPVKRLGSMQAASELVVEQNRIEALSENKLASEYGALGLPEQVGKLESKEEMRRRLTLVALWKRLPTKELQKECREHDVAPGTGAVQSQDLVERLILGLYLDAWEKEGIPVKRIETVAAAKRIVERVRLLKSMTQQEMKEEYMKLGLPGDAEDIPEGKELLTRLKKVARWRELSVKELQRECKEDEITVGGITGKVGDPEHQHELVDRLILAMCASSWATKGVPVRRLGSMQAAEKFAKALARLNALSGEELKTEYRGLGLPATAGRVPDGEEVLERLTRVALWWQLPVHELRKECQECNVSTGSLSGALSDEGTRREVVERLMLVLFADAWEARGLPLRRFGSIQAAVDLVRETERLNSASDEDLQREYDGLNLPPDAPPPGGSAYVLKRLKQVTLWRSLPMHELRKECQEHHTSCVGEDTKMLVERLIMATWGPLHSRPESENQRQRPGFSIPKGPPKRPQWEKYFPGVGGFGDYGRELFAGAGSIEAMSKYLKNLELSVGATAEDVKRSYKKLALKYHPDKNLGDTQEEASKRFREVQESYEILCKFFEDHPQAAAPPSKAAGAPRPGAPPPPRPGAPPPRPGWPRAQAAAPRPGGVPRPGAPGVPGQRPGFFPYARR